VGDPLKEYELLFIVSPRVAADDIPAAIDRVSTLIQDGGGEVTSTENWGRRRLAYPIKHYFEGTYVLTALRMPPEAAAPLEASLIISEEVIRHLLTEGIIPPTNRDRGRPFDGGDDRDRMPRPAIEESSQAPEQASAGEAAPGSAPASEAEEPGSPAETPEPAPAAVE
jgi:small subunit ribosomal protein S6